MKCGIATLLALLAALGGLLLGPASGVAAPLGRDAMAQAVGQAEPLVRNSPRRARPRIRVRPAYPYRSEHSFYPLPYDTEFPGPNAVRRCVDRYVTEHRLSGTVIVPRMRCWWAPG